MASRLRFHEGKACDAILRRLEAREGARRTNLGSPERERHPAPVELACEIGDRLFAIEHTGIEPFPGHMPETWFFLAVHDLFAAVTDDSNPGIAGPLHRFTKHCAALIDPRIKVPENENSFQKRPAAALGRRTGKISVIPRRFFPGETAPPI